MYYDEAFLNSKIKNSKYLTLSGNYCFVVGDYDYQVLQQWSISNWLLWIEDLQQVLSVWNAHFTWNWITAWSSNLGTTSSWCGIFDDRQTVKSMCKILVCFKNKCFTNVHSKLFDKCFINTKFLPIVDNFLTRLSSRYFFYIALSTI